MKNLLTKVTLASTLVLGSLFGSVAPAEAGVVCGQNSFVIEHSRNDSYVMFYNGGRVRFSFDDGTQSNGRWWWRGNDAVTNLNGYVDVWDDVRTQRCSDYY